MAVTSIHPIKATMTYAIDYVINPIKTDEQILVTGNKCTAEIAAEQFEMTRSFSARNGANLGWHLIQSFAPNEISDYTKAHEIGIELAKKTFGEQYEFVVSTHIDKDHVHNHIIFNSVDTENYKHYVSNKKSYYEIRNTSDQICKDNNLSIIEKPKKSYGKKNFKKNQAEKKNFKSLNEAIIYDLKQAINNATSYENFIDNLKGIGYQVKQGSAISLQKKGMERYRRISTLSKSTGEDFSVEEIKRKIENGYKYSLQEKEENKESSRQPTKLADLLKVSYEKLPYEEKKKQLETLTKTLNYLAEYKINSMGDIEQRAVSLETEERSTRSVLQLLQDKTDSLSEGYVLAKKYVDVKARIDKLKSTGNSKDLESQERVLQRLQSDLKSGGFEKLSEALAAEKDIKELRYARIEVNNKYQEIRKEREEISVVKTNISAIRDYKDLSKEKDAIGQKRNVEKREDFI